MKNLDSVDKNFRPRPPQIIVSNTPLSAGKTSLLAKAPASRSKRIFKGILGLIALAIVVLGTLVVFRATSLSDKIFVGQKTTFLQKIKSVFLGGGGVKLVGEDLGQVNILLLGIGGEGHDGPYLSDTMILAQIRPDIGQVALTSIPRDYLIDLPDNSGQAKINAAFAQGFSKHKDWNQAGQYAMQAVEKMSGLKIPYFAVVDFAGFEDAVNEVGGIDVHVDRTFTDYSFPDGKTGYLPALTFTEGWEHMNGTRALQFSRSRHAAGSEGSDFARSQRQQKVIEAFKEKVTSLNFITDAKKINSLLGIFANHFHTNISPAEIYRVYSLSKEKNIKDFLTLSLDPATNLVCSKILEGSGAYVVVPCEGKTDKDIQNYFKNSFALGRIYEEKSVIWLSDSTAGKTAYKAADQKLKDSNLTVWEVPYTKETFPKTIFYQVNPKPATAEFLKNTLDAAEVTLPPPGYKIDKSKVDIIVILGGTSNN